MIDHTNCIDESLREAVSEIVPTSSKPRLHEDFKALVEDKEFYDQLAEIDENEITFLEGLRRYEKIVESKNAKLRVPGKNFKFCLEIMEQPYNEEETRKLKQVFIGSPNNKISQLLASISATPGGQQGVDRPIIIVPSEVLTGNLNTDNAIDFLAEGKYKIVDRSASLKHRCPDFSIDLLEQKVTFQILDDIVAVKHTGRINNVAAMFIANDPFQFRDMQEFWGVNSIAKLFRKVRCYLLTFADSPIHKDVQNWNVCILKLNRSARHKDLLVHQEFMADFKAFLLSES